MNGDGAPGPKDYPYLLALLAASQEGGMTVVGHHRRFKRIDPTSGLPSLATVKAEVAHFAFVPTTDLSRP
jgi:hypothetical protein